MELKRIFPQHLIYGTRLPINDRNMRPSTFIKDGRMICIGYSTWAYYLFHRKCCPVLFTFLSSQENENVDSLEFLKTQWTPNKGIRNACDACGKDLFDES